MRKSAVIFIPKRAFAGIDAFAPLLAHLGCAYDHKTVRDTVLITKRAGDGIDSSTFHRHVFYKFSRVHNFELADRRPSKLTSLMQVAAFSLLLMRRRLTCRKVVSVFGGHDKSRRGRLIERLASVLGEVYIFPATQAVITSAYERRLSLEYWQKLIELGVKSQHVVADRPPRKAICYVPDEVSRIQRVRFPGTEISPIGLPRLYSTWPSVVADLGDDALRGELTARGIAGDTERIATIILTNPDYFWFPDKSTSSRLLRESVTTIRLHFPDVPIFLKAKADMVQLFDQAVADIGDDNVHFTTLGLAALASRSILAVTIQESTGTFDFVTVGVPAIEYACYSETFTSIYPEKSPWRDLPGLELCEDLDALDRSIAAIRTAEFRSVDRKTLSEYFGHQESLSIFGLTNLQQVARE